MYCDLNVPSQNAGSIEQTLNKLIQLGYGVAAITTTVDETVFQKKSKKKKNSVDKEINDAFPEPLDTKPLKQKFGKKIEIYTRLNLIIKENTELVKAFQSKNVKRYDIISVQPETIDVLKFISSYPGINIVSYNPESKNNIYMQRKLYNQIVNQGMYFELLYGPMISDSTCRRHLISLAHAYHALGKSRNIIVSSGCSQSYLLRGPYNIMNLNLLFGLSEEKAKSSISYNCLRVLQEAKKHARGKSIVTMTQKTLPMEIDFQGDSEVTEHKIQSQEME